MMKQLAGKWVPPFAFTTSQREKLMFAWTRKSDLEKAESYIDSVERLVEWWLSFADDPKATIPDIRDRATAIQKAVKALRKALDSPPENVVISLQSAFRDQLYLSPENSEEFDDLRRVSSTAHPGLIDFTEVLDRWLNLLDKSVEKLTDKKGNSSKDKSTEKELLHWLASACVRHFGKPPSATRESNFRKFVTELSGVLNRQFGETILKEVIKTTRLRTKKTLEVLSIS